MTDIFTGYPMHLERRDALLASASPMPLRAGEHFEAPAEIDPRPWHRIENQGPMGSCQGQALASVGEMAYHIATGDVVQFSPLFAYYASQQIDRLNGRDAGSTIDGGRRCAEEYGLCPLEVMPYPNPVVYRWAISQAAFTASANFKIRSHEYCKTYADVFNFLASGQGGVEFGIAWGNAMIPDSRGVIERFYPGTGGHATCFLGYSQRKDSQGRNYLWLANSWGVDNWGNRGWAEVAPVAVEQMLNDGNTVMIGMSDLIVAKPRRVEWAKSRAA